MSIRWRIALPVAHCVLDCVCLLLWLGYANRTFQHRALKMPMEIHHVALLQEAGAPGWDFRHDAPLPAEYLLFESGTLPALLPSVYLRPQAHLVFTGDHWDPIWFGIHELIAALLWFAIGWSLDAHWLSTRVPVIAYLFIRLSFIALFEVGNSTDIGWKVQTLWWLWFFSYLMFAAVKWIIRKILPRERRSAQA